jgi:upstream activation factor subunit UAF30
MPRTANASFMKLQHPDAVLAAIIGPEPRPRTEITVRIWAYIKSHGLQDAKNRRFINARTPEFAALLGADWPVVDGVQAVSMFQLPGVIGRHIAPAEG